MLVCGKLRDCWGTINSEPEGLAAAGVGGAGGIKSVVRRIPISNKIDMKVFALAALLVDIFLSVTRFNIALRFLKIMLVNLNTFGGNISFKLVKYPMTITIPSFLTFLLDKKLIHTTTTRNHLTYICMHVYMSTYIIIAFSTQCFY